jgi:hypothetical protein
MKTTRILRTWIALLTVTGSAALAAEPSAGTATNPPTLKGAKNVVVFAEPTSFAGWPANNGAWTWDDGKEILRQHHRQQPLILSHHPLLLVLPL